MFPGLGALGGTQRKPASVSEPQAPVGISQHPIQIILPNAYKSPEEYQNHKAWGFPERRPGFQSWFGTDRLGRDTSLNGSFSKDEVEVDS